MKGRIMLLIGILLLGAAGAFTGLLIAYNLSGGPETTVTVFGNTIATMHPLPVFLSGVALALLFCLGCALALAGAARSRHRSTEWPGGVRSRVQMPAAPRDTSAGPAGQDAPESRRRHRHHFGLGH